jgi:hypothetical protein
MTGGGYLRHVELQLHDLKVIVITVTMAGRGEKWRKMARDVAIVWRR